MSRVVVDTDVVSFLFKRDSRSELYRAHLVGNELIIFMTVAELYRWALVRNWGDPRKARLESHLRSFAVHPFEVGLCRIWAEISHGAQSHGRPIATADAWIAATAVYHGLPLVTHNRAHYAGVRELELVSATAE